MRRILDVRIVRWELKLVYVVGVLIVGFPIATVLYTVGATPLAVSVINTAVEMAAFLLAVRIFRAKGEAMKPPRAWWRMTGRPTLSRRLGTLFLILAVLGVASVVLQAIGTPKPRPVGADPEEVFIVVIMVLHFAAMAFLYLNSAARLKRLGIPAEDPKFRPTIKLKP